MSNESMADRRMDVPSETAEILAENAALRAELLVAVRCMSAVRLEPLDDKTPERYVASLREWREHVTNVCYWALKTEMPIARGLTEGRKEWN